VVKLKLLSIILMLLFVSTGPAGCGAKAEQPAAGHAGHAVALAAAEAMPGAVRSAPEVVRDAYRFAAANAEVLQQFPCYCGCGGMGHLSNYGCFWQEGGSLDSHALGCGICVDMAQDVRRGLEQGVPLDRLRAQIDADYSRFGPATDTPPIALAD
jgi:hypothetical protein